MFLIFLFHFRFADATFQINSFELEDLLPENTDVYYRYSGSLTTPDCNQVVVWTLFKETVEISEAQVPASWKKRYYVIWDLKSLFVESQLGHGYPAC